MKLRVFMHSISIVIDFMVVLLCYESLYNDGGNSLIKHQHDICCWGKCLQKQKTLMKHDFREKFNCQIYRKCISYGTIVAIKICVALSMDP